MVIHSKTGICGFLVYTGTETQVLVDDIDPYEGKLTVYFILGRKFNIRVFSVKILLKFRDVGFVLKEKEGVVNIPSIEFRFKLHRAEVKPLPLLDAHECVGQDWAEASAHTHAIKLKVQFVIK